MTASLETFMDALVAEHSPDRVWRSAADFFAANGFDRLIYTDIRAGRADIRTTLPPRWLETYRERRYERIDPFFRYCCTTLKPVSTGIDYLSDHGFLTASERRLIREASEAGLRAGFSCTVRLLGPEGVGGWNIGSSLSRREVERIRRENDATLRLAALYAHERLRPLSPAPREADLSPRQRECLLWSARLSHQGDRRTARPGTGHGRAPPETRPPQARRPYPRARRGEGGSLRLHLRLSRPGATSSAVTSPKEFPLSGYPAETSALEKAPWLMPGRRSPWLMPARALRIRRSAVRLSLESAPVMRRIAVRVADGTVAGKRFRRRDCPVGSPRHLMYSGPCS